jgi:hypothetical protein
LTDLVLTQLTDLFRIGLIIGLVFTMRRTAAVTGRVFPLLLGVIILAFMLPITMPSKSVIFTDAVLAGLVSNSIILVTVLTLARIVEKFRH